VYNGIRTISPNAQLSVLLTNLNYRMIMSEMTSRPATNMPLGATISEAQRHGLEEYFLGLAKRAGTQDDNQTAAPR